MNGEQPTTEQPLESHEEVKEHKRTFWKFTGAFLLILFVALITYGIWYSYFGETIEREAAQRQLEQNVKAWQNFEAEYERAMREDTFGGKTPRETLDLFVTALEAGDIELAVKYFILDPGQNSQGRRLLIKEFLENQKAQGALINLVNLLSRAEPDPAGSLYESDYGFVVYEQGRVISEINLELNEYSGVWKLQSF